MFTSRKLKHNYLSPVHSRTTSQYFHPTVALTFVASFLDEWVINLNANGNSPLLLLTKIGKIKYTVLSILSFFLFLFPPNSRFVNKRRIKDTIQDLPTVFVSVWQIRDDTKFQPRALVTSGVLIYKS